MRVIIERTVVQTIADTDIPAWLADVLVELVRHSSKITAIKAFRSYMRERGYDGVGLKEAKDFIEGPVAKEAGKYPPYQTARIAA